MVRIHKEGKNFLVVLFVVLLIINITILISGKLNYIYSVNYPIPVFAFFAGIIFLNEKFNTLSILSLILVVLSVYISQKK